jgi:hypothetical protein
MQTHPATSVRSSHREPNGPGLQFLNASGGTAPVTWAAPIYGCLILGPSLADGGRFLHETPVSTVGREGPVDFWTPARRATVSRETRMFGPDNGR